MEGGQVLPSIKGLDVTLMACHQADPKLSTSKTCKTKDNQVFISTKAYLSLMLVKYQYTKENYLPKVGCNFN